MSFSGFTLIETLIVLAILFLVAGFGLFISVDFYGSYSQNYEQNLIAGLIQRARSEAMANVNQVKHGACYDSGRQVYVLFDDSSSCTTDSTTFKKANAASVQWPTPIIFNQLDGSCLDCPLTVAVSGPGRASVSININSEGRIDW